MKTTLFMATSINGFVTGENDDTEWVKDTDALYQIIADKGVCVMGRRTYDECVKYNAFPYKGALNIVMTHDKALIAQSNNNAIFTSTTPEDIIKLADSRGHKELLIVGGGNVNAQFLAAGLIDEVIIDVHPIIIDHGINLFTTTFPRTNLKLISTTKLNDDIVQNHYAVVK